MQSTTELPANESEHVVRQNQAWGYIEDCLIRLGSNSSIRFVELATPIFSNENGATQITISDMIISSTQVATLKNDLQQLEQFKSLDEPKDILQLNEPDNLLRINLSSFLKPCADTHCNFKPLFEIADIIYDILKRYDCDIYELSKQLKFSLLSARDSTWKTALSVPPPLSFFGDAPIEISKVPCEQVSKETCATPSKLTSTSKHFFSSLFHEHHAEKQSVLSIINPDTLKKSNKDNSSCSYPLGIAELRMYMDDNDKEIQKPDESASISII